MVGYTKYLHGTYLLNILMIFWHKRKIDNFDPHNVLLAIATNIPVLLMTGFVLQGHMWNWLCDKILKICYKSFSMSKQFCGHNIVLCKETCEIKSL